MLAADGFHELAGSSTVDAGAVDGSSDTADIDGQRRAIGGAPDIGADELGLPTSTEVTCSPNTLQLSGPQAQCAVTVTDTSTPPPTTATFLSGIRFSSDASGSFGADCEVLNMINPLQGACTNPYKPAVAGIHDHRHLPGRRDPRSEPGLRSARRDPARRWSRGHRQAGCREVHE
jgi:hypothetical protein